MSRDRTLDSHAVFYESFHGSQIGCNPEAIFRELLSDSRFAHFTHIWALKDAEKSSHACDEYRNLDNVSFVEPGSADYFNALRSSKYIINNMSFDARFTKSIGQVYLNTWHGQPLKRMGFDLKSPLSAQGTLRNFLMADFLLSSSDYMTERLYLKAFRLVNRYAGTIVQDGTPRLDRAWFAESERESLRSGLENAGIELTPDQQIILYAPTWKGDSFNRPINETMLLRRRVEELSELIDQDRFRILLKVHQQVFDWASNDAALRTMLIPNEMPTNAALNVCDALVTDYSSIAFDYLPTGRPILFHVPDLETYARQRGLYLDPTEWPGPLSVTLAELAHNVNEIATGSSGDPMLTHRQAYDLARARFCDREDGGASRRVIDLLFNGEHLDHEIVTRPRDGRTSLLINLDGDASIGRRIFGQAVFDNLDLQEFDVSVLFGDGAGWESIDFGSGVTPFINMAKTPRDPAEEDLRSSEAGPNVMPGVDEGGRPLFRDLRLDQGVDVTINLDDLGSWEPVSYERIMRSAHGPSQEDSSVPAVAPSSGPGGVAAAVESLMALYPLSTLKDEVERRLLLEEMMPGVAGKVFVTIGPLDTDHNHRRLLRAFQTVRLHEPSAHLIIVGDGPNLAWLRRLVHNYELTPAVTFAGELENPYPILAASDCFVISADVCGQAGILAARILGVPVVSTNFPGAASVLPDGVGLRVEPKVASLAEAMRCLFGGEIPHPPFDHAAHNRGAAEVLARAVGDRTAGAS